MSLNKKNKPNPTPVLYPFDKNTIIFPPGAKQICLKIIAVRKEYLKPYIYMQTNYYFTLCMFFTSFLTDGFSLESE